MAKPKVRYGTGKAKSGGLMKRIGSPAGSFIKRLTEGGLIKKKKKLPTAKRVKAK